MSFYFSKSAFLFSCFPKLSFYFPEVPFAFQKYPFIFQKCLSISQKWPIVFQNSPLVFQKCLLDLLCTSFFQECFLPAGCTSSSCSELFREIIFTLLFCLFLQLLLPYDVFLITLKPLYGVRIWYDSNLSLRDNWEGAVFAPKPPERIVQHHTPPHTPPIYSN